ncbi:MAG: IS3 family transposase [Eubacteriales bacterium]|nr:IS3 family transposase [Eubacteriales bacterium]
MGKSAPLFEVIYQTAQEEGNDLSIELLCEIAGVSRSGYYAWVKAIPDRAKREQEDREDFKLILIAYNKRGYTKGARGIYMCLLHMDPPIKMNLKKIRRLMKKYNLQCPVRSANPYRQMQHAIRTSNYAENLLQREFECYGPRMVLLTDITYIPYNGVFAYLSVILDAYTKQILSYVLSESLEVDFVKETVEQLIKKHGIDLHKETIIHSDQGSHYTSLTFIKILKDSGIRQSMSRRGNCWDNAPQESFFGHMKDHLMARIADAKTFDQIKYAVDDYMDYYNNERYVWDLAYLSPNEYYEFVTTGRYPLAIPNPPKPPAIQKRSEELGKKKSEPAEAADDKCS